MHQKGEGPSHRDHNTKETDFWCLENYLNMLGSLELEQINKNRRLYNDIANLYQEWERFLAAWFHLDDKGRGSLLDIFKSL